MKVPPNFDRRRRAPDGRQLRLPPTGWGWLVHQERKNSNKFTIKKMGAPERRGSDGATRRKAPLARQLPSTPQINCAAVPDSLTGGICTGRAQSHLPNRQSQVQIQSICGRVFPGRRNEAVRVGSARRDKVKSMREAFSSVLISQIFEWTSATKRPCAHLIVR